MSTNSQVAVVAVGPLPPPLHGESRICELVTVRLQERCRLSIGDVSPKSLVRGTTYHIRRIVRVARAVILLFMNSRNHDHRLYLAVDSGWGLIYAILLVAVARLTRHDIFMHHHSYTYISRRFRLAAVLFWLGGKRGTHILLCTCMEKSFRNLYGAIGRTLIVSNAWQSPPALRSKNASANRLKGSNANKLTVGLLSNLCPEKGLLDFIDLLRVAKSRNLPISGVLAGPPVSDVDSVIIADAQRELGPTLRYLGAVYGGDKERFYSQIDVFLFATHYEVESQGMVVLDAMAHGIPVIALGRGCIPEMLAESGSVALPQDDPFISSALAKIQQWQEKPAVYFETCAKTRQKHATMFWEAMASYDHLIAMLTTPCNPSNARPIPNSRH